MGAAKYNFERVFLIVLDGVGVGGAPDAAEFGDAGSDTLRHVMEKSDVTLHNMARLGLGDLYGGELAGLSSAEKIGCSLRLTEVSPGKDSTSGHWEMMGIRREQPAPTFPHGFPKDLIEKFSNAIGRPVLGNKVASGTVIIQELGEEQMAQGAVLVYTSADSVFQIAAHTDIVPIDELYSICRIAREMLADDLAVDRVIARPYIGEKAGEFTRTKERKDFSLEPPGPTALDVIKDAGLEVLALGKVYDLFAGQGYTWKSEAKTNDNLMQELISVQAVKDWRGLCFCNLVEFDTLYGHRNNIEGFAEALWEFDSWLGGFMPRLSANELLLITADHGNDPSTESTDHSREQVPLMIYSPAINGSSSVKMPHEPGFFHVGKTVTEVLGCNAPLPGISVLAR